MYQALPLNIQLRPGNEARYKLTLYSVLAHILLLTLQLSSEQDILLYYAKELTFSLTLYTRLYKAYKTTIITLHTYTYTIPPL